MEPEREPTAPGTGWKHWGEVPFTPQNGVSAPGQGLGGQILHTCDYRGAPAPSRARRSSLGCLLAALQGGLAVEPGSPRATGAPGRDAHVLTALLLEHQFQREARGPRHQTQHILCLLPLFCLLFYKPFIKCNVTDEKRKSTHPR